MSIDRTHRIQLAEAAHPGARKELTTLAKSLSTTLETVATGYAVTTVAPVSEEDDDWTLKVTLRDQSKNGADVEFWWKKDAPSEGLIEVTTHQAIADKVRVLILLVAILGFMFLADQHSELLPVLRGLRVTVGGLLGVVVGLPVAGVMGALVGQKSDASVQGAAELAHATVLALTVGREVSGEQTTPCGGEVAA